MAVDAQAEGRLRQALVEQYQYVESIGLNELASGNLSCRFGDGMLISPAGATSANISADAIVLVSRHGSWNESQQPSNEWPMHAAIYASVASANALVHTHSDYCVALACQRRELPGFHYLVGTFGGTNVPCIPYSTFGSSQLAEDAALALMSRTACLLGSHGMIARGSDLVEAVTLAHRLEILCRQYLLACQLGEPALLTASEWQDFFERAGALGYGRRL
ncbi:MAG: class II aldolase/adducin family protein [Pseudomonadota bacterium]